MKRCRRWLSSAFAIFFFLSLNAHAAVFTLTINVNGCPNSCARFQIADIGLKGMIVTDEEGRQVEGFQVHLGGALGVSPGFGRKLRGLKVTAEDVPDYIERVVRRFAAQRTNEERFAHWVARAEEEDLT